jgi:tetratricopeptide (TPR) repeat protein
MQKYFSLFTVLIIAILPASTYAQIDPSAVTTTEKIEQYQERLLPHEKTGRKKFTFLRKFAQNTGTHYNYWFNANEKLKEVVEQAKLQHKDDYNQLLSFYPYLLSETASNNTELDSVIYKATAGILLHDLRNNWVDNLYLLIAQAYLHKNDFDTANQVFQFINYQFAQGADGSMNLLGSNANDTEEGEAGIVTKESGKLLKKMFTRPPSRNDALIWQVRTLTEQKAIADAAGYLAIIKKDKNLPKRLKNDLNEQEAFLFYTMEQYDSSAFYLKKAISRANTKQDKARWYYLIGQMYSLSKNFAEANKAFKKAGKLTNSPILEIYSKLQIIRNLGEIDSNGVNKQIDALRKMARRDQFSDYKNIIYYMLGEIELKRGNTSKAMEYFNKSLANKGISGTGSENLNHKIFTLLAQEAYNRKDFVQAANFYDSLQASNGIADTMKLIKQRQLFCGRIRDAVNTILINDSLLAIGLLPENEREAKIEKEFNKAQKIKGIDNSALGGPIPGIINPGMPMPNIGGTNTGTSDWYFANPSARSQGYNEFKARWGNRPNVDNWRRKSSVRNAGITKAPGDKIDTASTTKATDVISKASTLEDFRNNVPTTTEQIDSTKKVLADAWLLWGKTLIYYPEEYAIATEKLETHNTKYPKAITKAEALYLLYYAHTKLGNLTKASQYKQELINQYPESKFAKTLNAQGNKNNEVAKLYDNIYGLFINGQWEKALELKRQADAKYGNTYITPQLMYVEGVALLKMQKTDSANIVLMNLMTTYAGTPLAEKAMELVQKIGQKKQIEDEIRALNTKKPDYKPADTSFSYKPIQKPIDKPNSIDTNTVKKPTNINKPITSEAGFILDESKPFGVVIHIFNTDNVWIKEGLNGLIQYNATYHGRDKLTANKYSFKDNEGIIVIDKFVNSTLAMAYMNELKTESKRDFLSFIPAANYNFYITNLENVEPIKNNNEVSTYINFLKKQMPGKF